MEPSQVALVDRVQMAVDAVRGALAGPSPASAGRLARIARELSDVPVSVHSEGQLFALLGVCRFFQQPGQDNARALEAAVLLGKRALALGRPQERLSALLDQALIHDELDNHLEAVEAYGEARAVAAEIGLVRAEVSALVMAAQTLRHGGDPVGAEGLARHALGVAEHAVDIDDLRAIAWTTIAQWHLCVEEPVEGLAAIRSARASLGPGADPGMRATLEYTEVLLMLLGGEIALVPPLLDSLASYAKAAGTIGAALAHAAARGAADIVQGGGEARIRLVLALERARRVPRALADVLMAALVAEVVLGHDERAAQLREELSSLYEARRSAGQLQATLLRGPVIGFGALGKSFDVETYERRLALAQKRLLAGRD